MRYLTSEDHRTVSEAVAEAELTTSGEILTVLAERSDGYTDVILWYAIAAGFTAMSLFALFPAPFTDLWDAITGGWRGDWTTGELASMTIGLGVVTLLLTWLLLAWDGLTYLFIPGPVKTARVHDTAVRHFKVGAERRTHGRTGVLLYLSMKEHRAEIVADEPIAKLVPAEVWGEAMADMLAEVKQGNIAQGLAAGIRDVGKVLSEHFPRADDDENELPDRLIEL